MSKFKVGDRVERIGSLIPIYMRDGVVVSVTPNKDGAPHFTEYEVDFKEHKATFFETQLKLIESPRSGNSSR